MKLNRIVIFALLCLPLLAGKCGGETTNNGNSMIEKVYGKVWLNLYEKDANGAKAYQVSTADFPPSRGRYGFEIKADGSFYETMPGPTDIPERRKGMWEWVEEGKSIRVKMDSNSYQLELVEMTEDGLLMIKKTAVDNK